MAKSLDPHNRDSHDWTGEPDAPAALALIAALGIAAMFFVVLISADVLH